jgi:hypothetical protein
VPLKTSNYRLLSASLRLQQRNEIMENGRISVKALLQIILSAAEEPADQGERLPFDHCPLGFFPNIALHGGDSSL